MITNTHVAVLAEYGPIMGSEHRDAAKAGRSVHLREKALGALVAVSFLGIVVAITVWLEDDVLHEQFNGDGLADLVMLALAVGFAVAAVAAAGLTRGLRMAVARIRKRRNA